jgi:uncharacterized protein (DUF488 family)
MNSGEKTIWTVGHSTRSITEFLGLLSMHRIELLVDIRSYPGSRRYPHFNKETLAATLLQNGIRYEHMAGLGGRRKPDSDSLNSAWRHPAFRGYADYMQTAGFKESIAALQRVAENERTAYMCSEAPLWKCHRALVSDFLKVHGWMVLHIMEKGKLTEHPFTSPARMAQGELFYSADEYREKDVL